MKKLYGLLAALFMVAAVMGQATPQEKHEIKNDLARERSKRFDATRDVVRGDRAAAREDHREAVVYHKAAVRKAKQVHRRNVQQRKRRHHRAVVHHRRHHRVHRVVHH